MTLRKINSGSGHRYEDNGRKVPGVTTVISAALAKPALINWAARQGAEYAVNHWDELVAMAPTDRLNAIATAHNTRTRKAMARGSEIHRHGESLARTGEVTDVAPEDLGPVTAYARWLDKARVEPVAVERAVINRSWNYAGSFDLVATVGETLWLLDLKTGEPPRTGKPYAEHVLQLSAYAHATEMLNEAGDAEEPMPAVERAGVLYVMADDVVLSAVDVEPAFEPFCCLLAVATWLWSRAA